MCPASKVLRSCLNRADLNCHPLLVVIVEGTLKQEIQPLTKAWAVVTVVISLRGIASVQ